MAEGQRQQCPCCGYYTLHSRGGYLICHVCFWEDDEEAETFGQPAPERARGPNHVHLWEARKNFLTFGAAEKKDKRMVRPPRMDELPENN